MTLKMTTAQVVETSVTVNISPIQDYAHTDDCTLPNYFNLCLRGLCDVTNQGRLNSEQFSLAMYLIHQKVMGVDPPQTLSAEMIPPSMRNGSASTPTATGEDRVGVTVRC